MCIIISLLFPLVSNANISPISPILFGRFVVDKAWYSLGFDLSLTPQERGCPYTEREIEFIVEPMFKIWANAYDKNLIEFRPGHDPVFITKRGEPPRTAVTTRDPLSKIIFNETIINDSNKFGFAHATQLIVHELGHKIPHEGYRKTDGKYYSISQDDIDTVAGKVFTLNFARVSNPTFVDQKGIERTLLLINSNNIWSRTRVPEVVKKYQPPEIAILDGSRVFPLTREIFKAIIVKNNSKSTVFFDERLEIQNVVVTNGKTENHFNLSVSVAMEVVRSKIQQTLNFDFVTAIVSDGKSVIITQAPKIHLSYPVYPADLFLIQLDPDSSKQGRVRLMSYIDFRKTKNFNTLPQAYSIELIVEAGDQRFGVPIQIFNGIETKRFEGFYTLSFYADVSLNREFKYFRVIGLHAINTFSRDLQYHYLFVPRLDYIFAVGAQ